LNQTNKTIRWGVLGTARIAEKVGKAIQAAQGSTLDAIASRSIDKAESWAKQYGVPKSYGTYEALLEDDAIDALYIPLPPSLHEEWTIRAAENGKHVLCEKPLAMNVSEAKHMADACRQHQVQLMDGVMWVHHPRTEQMQSSLNQNNLGNLRRFTSSFSFHWETVPLDDIRMQPEMGGGSLMDLGWYCVRATLWAFQTLPRRVWGTAQYLQGVDLNFSGVMWFDSDRIATFDSGFNCTARKWFEVAGTHGSLVCDDFTNPWNAAKARFWMHDSKGIPTEHMAEPKIQEVCMIENFTQAIISGQQNNHWSEDAIHTQQVCDLLAESARTGHPLCLEP